MILIQSELCKLRFFLSKYRLEEQNKIVGDENALQIANEQFEEPLYFNITEEHPISWKLYKQMC